MIYISVLVFGAIIFWGTSESISPFKRPVTYVAARRWYLGRRLAILGMAILLLSLEIGSLAGLGRIQQLIIGVALFMVIAGLVELMGKLLFRPHTASHRTRVDGTKSNARHGGCKRANRESKEHLLEPTVSANRNKSKDAIDIEL